MGIYLNSKRAYNLCKIDTEQPYYVDKSQILEEIIRLVENDGSQICITRPRRFGKTVMANMISSYFSQACDADDIFKKLKISQYADYQKHLNQYRVIHISFNDLPRRCNSYREYIDRIERLLIKDIKDAYPDMDGDKNEAVWDTLLSLNDRDDTIKFIFILDEWDYIFHQSFVTEEEKKEYLSFLRSLLKDMPYVIFTYMTGILPIVKYSSGSELNMFVEFTMAKSPSFSDCFGFTEAEVSELYERYLHRCEEPSVTMEGLRTWYNGYHTASGERVYNPRSVILALSYNHMENYWTSAGPYDEIFYYIEHNVDDVRDDLALMVSGISVPTKIREYAATSMDLSTRDEIFSAMVMYGFLSYEDGKTGIPNQELMEKFADMLQKAPSNETELTAVVNLVYLAARDTYRIERKDKAGRGYVDFIFYPEMDKTADGIILELKVDSTPDAAIQQIKDKKYALKFKGKIGEEKRYFGRILAVGISYDRKKKEHSCKIEILTETVE